jgi:hypothetical protein
MGLLVHSHIIFHAPFITDVAFNLCLFIDRFGRFGITYRFMHPIGLRLL